MEQALHYLLWEWLSVAKQLAGHLQRQEIRPRAAWRSLGAKGLSVGARGRVFEPPQALTSPVPWCFVLLHGAAAITVQSSAPVGGSGWQERCCSPTEPTQPTAAPLGASHRWDFILGSGIEMAEGELCSEGRTLQRQRRPPGDAPREPCASMAPGAGSPPASC